MFLVERRQDSKDLDFHVMYADTPSFRDCIAVRVWASVGGGGGGEGGRGKGAKHFVCVFAPPPPPPPPPTPPPCERLNLRAWSPPGHEKLNLRATILILYLIYLIPIHLLRTIMGRAAAPRTHLNLNMES